MTLVGRQPPVNLSTALDGEVYRRAEDVWRDDMDGNELLEIYRAVHPKKKNRRIKCIGIRNVQVNRDPRGLQRGKGSGSGARNI